MNYEDEGQPIKARLGMGDAVAIIVGIVIGATIFKSPQLIMSNVSSPAWGMAAWALGGVLSLIGALCYAELASTYPKSGGDYYFLTRAFGSWCGFLFGWAQLVVILTGSIGIMAFVFGDYAIKVLPLPGAAASAEEQQQLKELQPKSEEHVKLTKTINDRRELWTAACAAGAVLLLTILNVLGVVLGKWTQNLLSLVKVLGLVAIAVIGFMYGKEDVWQYTQPSPEAAKKLSFGLAMVFVLYAFGGWNDAAFVAAEIRSPRSIIGALLIGTTLITIVYLVVNFAYLRALGFDQMRGSWTVAADAVQVGLKDATFREQMDKVALADPGRVVSVLVMISALGAINGLIFTGSRVYSALGADHSIFALLGRWSPMFGSPVWALLIQALICLGMIVGVGTELGRDAIDTALAQTVGRLNPEVTKMPWDQYFGGFDTLVAGTAPVFWGFFLLSGLSLFVLRQRDPDLERPFRVPLYPLVPLIFCGTCVYMLYSAFVYANWISLIGAVPLALGLPLYWLSSERPGLND